MAEPSTDHRVLDLRNEPRELSFEARIGDRRERIWMRTDAEGPTSPEAVLPACLVPAMRFGGTLEVPVPISPRLLRAQREYQGIQRAWSLGWTFGDPPLLDVEVRAPAAEPQPAPGNGRVAAFFSGGVDSWSTLLDHPEITDQPRRRRAWSHIPPGRDESPSADRPAGALGDLLRMRPRSRLTLPRAALRAGPDRRLRRLRGPGNVRWNPARRPALEHRAAGGRRRRWPIQPGGADGEGRL